MRALYSSLTLADVWGMREELFGAGDADDDGDEDRNGGESEDRATSASTPAEANIRRDVRPPRSGGGSTGVHS